VFSLLPLCHGDWRLGITKVDVDLCGDGEFVVPCHLWTAIPSQGFVELLKKLSCLFDQGCGHALGVRVRDFGQHHEAGMALHKRRDIAVVQSRDQVALPCVDAPFDARDIFNSLNM
jgi:hypothetical protein